MKSAPTPRRHPRKVSAVAAAAAAAMALSVPTPAAAATVVVEATDVRGDVRLTSEPGLGEAARRSIDLRSLRVVARDDGMVRFTVGIKRIMRERHFDQMVFITMLPPRDTDQRWDAQVGFTSKGPMSYASFSGERGGASTWCDIRSVLRAPAQAKLAVDVPRRCLPTRVARIGVDAYTGRFRSDAPTWSRDRLLVPGGHDVTPPLA